MKKILLMIMALGLLVSGCVMFLTILLVGSASAQNWIHSTDGNREGKKIYDLYYNPNFQKTETGTTVMKVKLVYTDWGNQCEIKDKPFLLHEPFDYSIQTWEFDIEKNTMRALRYIYFDSNDNILRDQVESNNPATWFTAKPGSMAEIWMTIAKGYITNSSPVGEKLKPGKEEVKEPVLTPDQRFNIFSDRVNVQANLTKIWGTPKLYIFDILIAQNGRQFKTGTGIFGARDIGEAVSRIKKSVGWKDDYLFVTSECGGGNAWRCDVDHVFSIRRDQLIYVGSIQGGEKPGHNYKNAYFYDTYDRLEINGLTTHVGAPGIGLVMKEQDGHFIVDLDQTWQINVERYKQNLEDIRGIKGSKYDYDEVRLRIASIVLFNAVLAKYCRHQGEMIQAIKEAKSLLKEDDFENFETLVYGVVPGELPECEEKYDSCFHSGIN
jgi:hypothetical protein